MKTSIYSTATGFDFSIVQVAQERFIIVTANPEGHINLHWKATIKTTYPHVRIETLHAASTFTMGSESVYEVRGMGSPEAVVIIRKILKNHAEQKAKKKETAK